MLVLLGKDIRKEFRRETGEKVKALDGLSLEAEHGTLTALVGPDGAGKTTLIRLMTGLLTADSGELRVLDVDVAKNPQEVQSRIGYMPQKFGLYEDLSVQENLNLYADLRGVSAAERRERYPRLMGMTGLGPFTGRLAGRLSGGMKQKLGLACTLVRSPELLLLDEPTVGVDPLSRRELWEIILQIVHDQGLTVLLSTSYLDEAERCGHVVVLHEGKVQAQGPPTDVTKLAAGRTFLAQPPAGQKARDLQARLLDEEDIVDALPLGGQVRFVRATDPSHIPHSPSPCTQGEGRGEGSSEGPDDVRQSKSDPHPNPLPAYMEREPELAVKSDDNGVLKGATITATDARFEDGFMVLLRRTVAHRAGAGAMHLETPPQTHGSGAVIQVRNLVRRFGVFVAVDHVNFEVRRGEIFGLLGPNGAGKTTTFRMLCGLLRVTDGTVEVAGVDLRHARDSARQRLGYVAQKFSLYGQLTVGENLEFFASAYSLRGKQKRARIAWAMKQFELESLSRVPAGQLPGGFKQRLAMAAALLHEPETLFLDEPTSGADPLARREFWRRITALAGQGVTVIVTTHFMEEAEYCDRIAIMDSGRVLAQGTPAEIRLHAHPQEGRTPTMEDAFIAIVEESRKAEGAKAEAAKGAA